MSYTTRRGNLNIEIAACSNRLLTEDFFQDTARYIGCLHLNPVGVVIGHIELDMPDQFILIYYEVRQRDK